MYDLEITKEKIINNIKDVYDPEISINIYDLGLIYSIKTQEDNGEVTCDIDMTLTSFACAVVDTLVERVELAALMVEEVQDVNVNLVFEPPWNQENITYEGRLELGLL
ncbi:iron-sulfur cluster assembly protein [Sulfurimonas sp.]|nr:iron-sulfur cluster assembly protein [Sulfurimonas sp.]